MFVAGFFIYFDGGLGMMKNRQDDPDGGWLRCSSSLILFSSASILSSWELFCRKKKQNTKTATKTVYAPVHVTALNTTR